MPSGIRVQITLPPLVESPALSIHRAASHPENLDELVPTLLSEAAANFIQEAICSGRSIVVVSNSYQSNPDYLVGALASSVPESNRVAALCSIHSLKLNPAQAVCLNISNGLTSKSDLIRHALNMKPSYMVLGDDAANAESIGYISASGHQPYIASIYASGIDQANQILGSHDSTQTDIFVLQESNSSGEPHVSAIYERQDGDYKEVFGLSEDGALEASV